MLRFLPLKHNFKTLQLISMPSRYFRPSPCLQLGRPIYKEQKMRKENPLKFRHSEEEQMRKRFVRNREDAKFGAMAEREFNKMRKWHYW